MFYMGKFGSCTPKRHVLWSNDAGLIDAIVAEAGYMSRLEQLSLPGEPLVKKYVDKLGVKRRVGKKKFLKASQHLVFQENLTEVHIR